MVNLILDTNIWITFVAKNNPPLLLEKLIQKAEEEEIMLLSNEIVLKEWLRNKSNTIKDVKKEIAESYSTIEKLSCFLSREEMLKLKGDIKPFFFNKDRIEKLALQRVEDTEVLLRKCKMTPITDEMKIKVSDWGIERQAPFKKKASVGDALILLSAVEYCKKNTSGVKDSIFVFWNHTDYTDGQNIDEIHNELKDLLNEANMLFKRNIGEVLNLTPKMTSQITSYINDELNKQMQIGMTELDFFEFHNYHIRFRLASGVEKSGVILDPMNYNSTGKPRHVYELILSNNLMAYKEAETNKEFDKMKKLKEDIDLTDIVWAQRI